MDRGDRHQHQHQFLMPPPVVPMMDEKFLGGGGGGGATPGRGAAGERKRRFTEEQIRSLESMFHAHHAKLEPREKAELARELGLQPRQVAIWFQNKRARWRSKQLEHDYAVLRAKYDDLHARLGSLKQEKLALIAQLHKLSERLREREERGGKSATVARRRRRLAAAAATAAARSCTTTRGTSPVASTSTHWRAACSVERPAPRRQTSQWSPSATTTLTTMGASHNPSVPRRSCGSRGRSPSGMQWLEMED